MIWRSPLFKHSSYKMMFMMGVADNVGGFFFEKGVTGVLSIIGTTYCENTQLLVLIGHLAHVAWYSVCMTGASCSR